MPAPGTPISFFGVGYHTGAASGADASGTTTCVSVVSPVSSLAQALTMITLTSNNSLANNASSTDLYTHCTQRQDLDCPLADSRLRVHPATMVRGCRPDRRRGNFLLLPVPVIAIRRWHFLLLTLPAVSIGQPVHVSRHVRSSGPPYRCPIVGPGGWPGHHALIPARLRRSPGGWCCTPVLAISRGRWHSLPILFG